MTYWIDFLFLQQFRTLLLILLATSPLLSREGITTTSERNTVQFGSFQNAAVIAVDQTGCVYVLDDGRNELLKMSPEGTVLGRVGGYGWSENEFDHPTDVVAPNGLDVYVTDYGNHRVQRFDRNLNFVSSFPPQSDADSRRTLGYPTSAAVSRLGELFIIDGDNRRVVEVTSGNSIKRTFGDITSGRGRLIDPKRIRVSDDDIVYVQDGNRIVLFDVFGNYLRTIGDGLFHHVQTFAVDNDTLYVLDSCALHIIRNGGSLEQTIDIREYLASSEFCDAFVDIAVQQQEVFMLDKHNVRIVRLQKLDASTRN